MDGGVSNVLVYIGKVNGSIKEPPKESKIAEISLLHEFLFMKDLLVVRKASMIGDGRVVKKVKQMRVGSLPTYERQLLTPTLMGQNDVLPKKTLVPYVKPGTTVLEKEKFFEDEDEDQDYSNQTLGAAFGCPNIHCCAQFIRYDRLQRHIQGGICKIRKENISGLNYVRTLFISKFGVSPKEELRCKDVKKALFLMDSITPPALRSTLPRMNVPLMRIDKPWVQQLIMGFALLFTKARRRLNNKQKDYIKGIFEEGRNGKKHARAADVAWQMKREEVDGKKVFSPIEW